MSWVIKCSPDTSCCTKVKEGEILMTITISLKNGSIDATLSKGLELTEVSMRFLLALDSRASLKRLVVVPISLQVDEVTFFFWYAESRGVRHLHTSILTYIDTHIYIYRVCMRCKHHYARDLNTVTLHEVCCDFCVGAHPSLLSAPPTGEELKRNNSEPTLPRRQTQPSVG